MYVLGLDLGTSALKGLVFDRKRKVSGRSSCFLPYEQSTDGV